MNVAIENRIALVGFVMVLPVFGYIGWDIWSEYRKKNAKKDVL